jgi:hypothetical protein
MRAASLDGRSALCWTDHEMSNYVTVQTLVLHTLLVGMRILVRRSSLSNELRHCWMCNPEMAIIVYSIMRSGIASDPKNKTILEHFRCRM